MAIAILLVYLAFQLLLVYYILDGAVTLINDINYNFCPILLPLFNIPLSLSLHFVFSPFPRDQAAIEHFEFDGSLLAAPCAPTDVQAGKIVINNLTHKAMTDK